VREVIPVVDIQAAIAYDSKLLGSDALGTGHQFLQTFKLNPGLGPQYLIAFHERPFGCEEVIDNFWKPDDPRAVANVHRGRNPMLEYVNITFLF
jgi:hypothetical protein